jgi:murein DD-endopeptidase MepM/ murein hydrolase activator NlpD
MEVKRGTLIGYVGVTGNSDPNAPHLHFAVVALTPEKQWWKGTPLNPFPLMSDQ